MHKNEGIRQNTNSTPEVHIVIFSYQGYWNLRPRLSDAHIWYMVMENNAHPDGDKGVKAIKLVFLFPEFNICFSKYSELQR